MGVPPGGRRRDAVAVDHAGEDDVEDKDDDDDDVADDELDQGGQDPAGRRVRVLPAHPVGALLRATEDDGVDVRHADDGKQQQDHAAVTVTTVDPGCTGWTQTQQQNHAAVTITTVRLGCTGRTQTLQQDHAAGVPRSTEPPRAVRTGDADDPVERQTGNQPVGVVASDAIGIVGCPTVGRVRHEALRWNHLFQPTRHSNTKILKKWPE